MKERENSVKHGPYFVNLLGLVHGLVCLIDQVQEALEANEVIVLYDFHKMRSAHDEVVASPLPVALIPQLDHTLLHLKRKAEECLQLKDTDRLEILGIL